MSEPIEFDCPEYVVALIREIARQVGILEWNRTQEDFACPTDNTGSRWENDTFSLRAYYWGDDEEEASIPNFKCGDIEVEWYKRLGRGTTINRLITPDEAVAMFDRCIASVDAEGAAFFEEEGIMW